MMNKPYVLVILLLLSGIYTNNAKHVSFTADGKWGPIPDNETETSLQQRSAAVTAGKTVREINSTESICNRFMCTPSNLTFLPNYANTLFDNNSACKALVDKGITNLYFYGDSFMRQIYAGMLITLNGDYKGGSLANLTLTPHCENEKQFNEKGCGTRSLNHYGTVCDGKIHLDPVLSGFGDLNLCSANKGSVVLWSFGNYKTTRNGRHGVNNATAYQEMFEKDICHKIKAKGKRDSDPPHNCAIYWISTHYRMKPYFMDESPELIKEYNLGMRNYFDEGVHCGDVNYIDVYNMTAGLGIDHKDDALKMTYDGVHWGYQPNLWKAQIILNAITS